MSTKTTLPRSISTALTAMQEQSNRLQALAEKNGARREFTLDGRLIGDVGELLAAMKMGVTLTETQKTGYDGTDRKKQQVEIKTTQANSFAFRKIAKRVICIKLHGTTHYEVVYNGLGQKLLPLFTDAAFPGRRPGTIDKEPISLIGQRQLSITRLQGLA